MLIGTPRLDDPKLYAWQLNENSTRYDYPRAIPDDRIMHIQFSILATINAIVATSVLILIVAMLRSPKVKTSVFNLYLLGIAFPDFAVSFFCLLTCALSADMSAFFSEAMCGFQSFYLVWGFSSNCWLNCVILYQVHTLLKRKQAGIRYLPPSSKQVYCHCFAVYAYSAIWAFITAFNLPFLPHETHLYYGLACFGLEYDRPSTFFFWLAFQPGICVIPISYAAYVCIDIWRRSLMPAIGRRRALFLLRLVSLYFAVWLPFLVLSLIGNFVNVPDWIFWGGAVFSHMQGLVSAAFCTTDSDINEAIRDLFSCFKRKSTAARAINNGFRGAEDEESRISEGSSSLLSFLSKGLKAKRWEVNWASSTKLVSSAVDDSQVVEVSQIADASSVDLPEDDETSAKLEENLSSQVLNQRTALPHTTTVPK